MQFLKSRTKEQWLIFVFVFIPCLVIEFFIWQDIWSMPVVATIFAGITSLLGFALATYIAAKLKWI